MFDALSGYASHKSSYRQMTQISSFVFLKNHLGKVFRTLKYNAYYHRQKKQQPRLYRLKVEKRVF